MKRIVFLLVVVLGSFFMACSQGFVIDLTKERGETSKNGSRTSVEPPTEEKSPYCKLNQECEKGYYCLGLEEDRKTCREAKGFVHGQFAPKHSYNRCSYDDDCLKGKCYKGICYTRIGSTSSCSLVYDPVEKKVLVHGNVGEEWNLKALLFQPNKEGLLPMNGFALSDVLPGDNAARVVDLRDADCFLLVGGDGEFKDLSECELEKLTISRFDPEGKFICFGAPVPNKRPAQIPPGCSNNLDCPLDYYYLGTTCRKKSRYEDLPNVAGNDYHKCYISEVCGNGFCVNGVCQGNKDAECHLTFHPDEDACILKGERFSGSKMAVLLWTKDDYAKAFIVRQITFSQNLKEKVVKFSKGLTCMQVIGTDGNFVSLDKCAFTRMMKGEYVSWGDTWACVNVPRK
jgi:hypothetical protein